MTEHRGHIDQLILQWKAAFALARVVSTPAVSQGLAHAILIRNVYVVLLVLLNQLDLAAEVLQPCSIISQKRRDVALGLHTLRAAASPWYAGLESIKAESAYSGQAASRKLRRSGSQFSRSSYVCLQT